MPSDNNQEMFPIVDEQGNITFSIRKEIYICRNVRNGKTSSPENGTQPLADILTWAKA